MDGCGNVNRRTRDGAGMDGGVLSLGVGRRSCLGLIVYIVCFDDGAGVSGVAWGIMVNRIGAMGFLFGWAFARSGTVILVVFWYAA